MPINNTATIILTGLVVLTTILYFREYYLNRKFRNEGKKALEEAQQKSFQLIHDSMKKSQDILGSAELEGIKIMAAGKVENSKLEKEMQTQVDEMVKQSEESIKKTETEVTEFLTSLKTRTQNFENTSIDAIQQKTNQLFDEFENRLSGFLVQSEQKSISAIELELQSARQLIESYKQKQLASIDENIVAMLERTLSTVLNKKLSLKDQVDLVYESLEKAKLEKFIG